MSGALAEFALGEGGACRQKYRGDEQQPTRRNQEHPDTWIAAVDEEAAQEKAQPPFDNAGSADLDGNLPPFPAVEVNRLPPPEIVLDLNRALIDQALAERPFLEQRLDTSSGVFSGRRLLEVREVEDGDLYDRFGLEAGDVLMLVDDQWITDQGNPLWQRLEERDDITLLVMRKGRPHRYRYRIR